MFKLLLLLLIDLQPLARTYQLVDDLGLHRPTILARELEHLAGTQTGTVKHSARSSLARRRWGLA